MQITAQAIILLADIQIWNLNREIQWRIMGNKVWMSKLVTFFWRLRYWVYLKKSQNMLKHGKVTLVIPVLNTVGILTNCWNKKIELEQIQNYLKILLNIYKILNNSLSQLLTHSQFKLMGGQREWRGPIVDLVCMVFCDCT